MSMDDYDPDTTTFRDNSGPSTEGLIPLSLPDETLVHFEIKTTLTDSNSKAWKKVAKPTVLAELDTAKDHGMEEVETAMRSYGGENYLFLRIENTLDENNYYWCSTLDSYDDHLQDLESRSAVDGDGLEDFEIDGGEDGNVKNKRGKYKEKEEEVKFVRPPEEPLSKLI